MSPEVLVLFSIGALIFVLIVHYVAGKGDD